MTLSTLVETPTDPLLGLIDTCRRDLRADKLDLGVGVLRDATGRTPVMRAVKAAERRLLETQASKSYLGADGDKDFVSLLEPIVLGAGNRSRLAGLQTPGGTGALRLAADLLALGGTGRVWTGTPGWPNHQAIFNAAGIQTRQLPVYDMRRQRLDGDQLLSELEQATAGDAVLLQGCCHNPTGLDPDAALWSALADVIARRGLVPLLDLAYQGLGDGLEADSMGVRTVMAQAEYALIAYSCDKNFGLYRDRVGALWVATPNAERARAIGSHLVAAARASWSMPPDHGAAVVRTVLEDGTLTADWRHELEEARLRLNHLREKLGAAGSIGDVDLTAIASGRGMFATLPLDQATILRLRTEHGIYMPTSGRVNIGGLSEPGIVKLVDALEQMLVGVPA